MTREGSRALTYAPYLKGWMPTKWKSILGDRVGWGETENLSLINSHENFIILTQTKTKEWPKGILRDRKHAGIFFVICRPAYRAFHWDDAYFPARNVRVIIYRISQFKKTNWEIRNCWRRQLSRWLFIKVKAVSLLVMDTQRRELH